jgi:hypothetical protein
MKREGQRISQQAKYPILSNRIYLALLGKYNELQRRIMSGTKAEDTMFLDVK